MLLRILPFSFLSVFGGFEALLPLERLAANSLTERFSGPLLREPLTMQLAVRLGGSEAGPQTPLSVDSSNASPESGVFPADVFGLEPSLNN